MSIFDSPAVSSEECSTSSSSSIGKNSDLSRGESLDGEGENEEEVQSNYKSSFNSMDSMEEALPMSRGISDYFEGKSKSFSSLEEATSLTSIKEIAKPENAYSRKRRNLSAHRWNNYGGRGISKRAAITSSKSTLALAVTMGSWESLMSSDDSSSSTSNCNSNSKSPVSNLPPLHPRSMAMASHYNLTLLDCP